MTTQTKVFKTCNCCLSRNHRPALMGERAKIKYCKSCKGRTVWSEADPEFLTSWKAERKATEDFMNRLLAEAIAEETR